jgi:hypothetical protein
LGLSNGGWRGVAGECIRRQIRSVLGSNTLASNLAGLRHLQIVADSGPDGHTLSFGCVSIYINLKEMVETYQKARLGTGTGKDERDILTVTIAQFISLGN